MTFPQPIDIGEIERVCGTLEFECVICGGRMGRLDLRPGKPWLR